MVDGLGNVVEVSQHENSDVLPALQTSLGLLGIMTQVTIKVVPAYELHAKTTVLPYGVLMECFDDYVENYRHLSFFWLPTDASAVLYCLQGGRTEFEGRPHWGKLHFMTADHITRRFPRYADFVQMRQRFDPKGTFLNEHLRALFA